MANVRTIPPEELAGQEPYIQQVRAFYGIGDRPAPLACVRTYGCQQNVSDSEHMKGLLARMGFGFTDIAEEADLILFNTCAVREHAQDRVFGNVGALKTLKRRKPGLLIALCGCMVQQETVTRRIRDSYPFVGLVFGTHVLHRLPELMARALMGEKRVIEIPQEDGVVAEGLPVRRDGTFKAFLPIMYGCNNFCTYCIVPYVRGRERSRTPEAVTAEAEELVKQGYKDITLLGQNVNSYGKGEAHGVGFPELLRRIDAIPGDFLIRFMTSHPKDATPELFEAIAASGKVSRHFHLPFQSGSNRVLRAMNRGYTREQYLDLIRTARRIVPGIVFTSDVIVGFPGETTEEFEDTLSLVEQVRFDALFTFIYSPRKGTPAAEMPDPISKEEKSASFNRLVEAQNRISLEKHQAYIGTVQRCLVDGEGEDPRHNLTARTPGGRLVHLDGDKGLIGQFVDVEITDCSTWALFGRKREG